MLSPFLVTFIKKFPGDNLSKLVRNWLKLKNILIRICFSVDPEYQTQYYYPLHTRFGPWVIGFVLGYYMFRIKALKTRKIELVLEYHIYFWVEFFNFFNF